MRILPGWFECNNCETLMALDDIQVHDDGSVWVLYRCLTCRQRFTNKQFINGFGEFEGARTTWKRRSR